MGVGHALALFVEPRRGGVVKHIGLLGPMSEIDSDDPFHPAAMERIGVDEAGGRLEEELDPVEISNGIVAAYRSLWKELTGHRPSGTMASGPRK